MRHEKLASLAALALLTLVGCSAEKADDAPADRASEATPPATVTAIPQAVQGRWGLVPADCTSTRGDAKGLLVIDATTLKFYESVATLGPVTENAAESIAASYAFTGEGQSWTLDISLEAQDGGKTLIRRDTGKDAAPAALKYTRC